MNLPSTQLCILYTIAPEPKTAQPVLAAERCREVAVHCFDKHRAAYFFDDHELREMLAFATEAALCLGQGRPFVGSPSRNVSSMSFSGGSDLYAIIRDEIISEKNALFDQKKSEERWRWAAARIAECPEDLRG